MCGIAGIVNFDGEPVAVSQIDQMIATLAHRGPDGRGVWVQRNVGLGHRRLAVRDLSDAGLQPMIDASAEMAVTYNGELYNDLELRRSLTSASGIQFSTACDTEVIAPSYRLWGKEAFLKFEGMYAIALWDQANERLILARDPVGIKPVYFSWVGRSLRFGSEVKALLALADQPRRLDAQVLHRFFAQGYPGPNASLLEGIVPLPPGSMLVADRSGWRIEAFWRPRRSVRYTNLHEALQVFNKIWAKVVDDQLISDVPVGLLLSGGIDSALVATALKHHPDVSAYTATFGDSAFDERGLAAIVASHANINHKLVPIDTTTNIEAKFLDVVAKSDGQLADSSSLAFYSLCQEASQSTRVLLTGDGADEFFAGYETYRATRLAGIVRGLMPPTVGRMVANKLFSLGGANRGRVSTAEKVARFLFGIANGNGSPHPQWRRYLFPEEAALVYGPGMTGFDCTKDALDDYVLALGTEGEVMDRALVADQRYYLPGDMLMKTDSMSMAHGVEIRVPFLDRRIMEFANSLDISLISPMRGPDKRLLRASLEQRGLPRNFTSEGKKGFNVPIARYLRDALQPLGSFLLDKEADCLMPFLRPDAVRGLWRRHLDGDSRSSYALWTFLTLAAWRTSAGI